MGMCDHSCHGLGTNRHHHTIQVYHLLNHSHIHSQFHFCPLSDIDLTILNVPITVSIADALHSLADAIRKHNIANYIEVISSAKVPIVKLDHFQSGLSIDLQINNTDGLRTGIRFTISFTELLTYLLACRLTHSLTHSLRCHCPQVRRSVSTTSSVNVSTKDFFIPKEVERYIHWCLLTHSLSLLLTHSLTHSLTHCL